MHLPSVEQLIGTTAAFLCGFCIPAGIAQYSLFAQQNKLHLLTGVHLGSHGQSFFEILTVIFFSFL